MKYGIWKVSQLEAGAVNALVGSGYAPLAAMVLASRGIGDDRQARAYLDCNAPLLDPFLMTDMDKAAGRVGLAMSRGEKIAVFGDYDVDGITATCLLTDFLRRHGADVVSYIPGRLEEGYGLNPIALRQLSSEGVKLIITVDCGITGNEEVDFAAIWGCILPLLYVGIFSCGVGYTLQILAQKGSNPTVVTILLSLESVFAVIAGAIILKQQMSVREYIGCAVMFAAVLLAQIDFPVKQKVE